MFLRQLLVHAPKGESNMPLLCQYKRALCTRRSTQEGVMHKGVNPKGHYAQGCQPKRALCTRVSTQEGVMHKGVNPKGHYAQGDINQWDMPIIWIIAFVAPICCTRLLRPFVTPVCYAPKGQHSIAQGNALGFNAETSPAPCKGKSV